MNNREKIVVLCSLSLGVMYIKNLSSVTVQADHQTPSAGACGIRRTMNVSALSSPNYLEDTVSLVVWTAAEIAVTMVCIGIPVCRPLYKRYLEKWTSRDASRYHPQNGEAIPYPLRTFGGSTLRPRQGGNYDLGDLSRGGDPIALEERKLGLRDPFTKSYAMGGSRVRGDNQSDEEILGTDFR
ncbi:hypothetical protein NW759_017023 [Fusarium solani]|nr:hypothetical protein NW759_017023 [Fusarium solani]